MVQQWSSARVGGVIGGLALIFLAIAVVLIEINLLLDKSQAPNIRQTSPIEVGAETPTQPQPQTQAIQSPAVPGPKNATTQTSPPPREIGMFISNSPDDPAASGVLAELRKIGVTTVYNYALIDGSAAQIQGYLDTARANGIKVIISLKDLYDQLPGGGETAASHPEFGQTNEAIAISLASRFGGHPAVWGFGITDEAPADSSQLAT